MCFYYVSYVYYISFCNQLTKRTLALNQCKRSYYEIVFT